MQVYKDYTYIGPGYQDTPVFRYATQAEKPNAINVKDSSRIKTDVDLINEGIYRVIRTHAWSPETKTGGERVGQPDFGSRLHELPFEQNDYITHELAKRFIQEALERWEPRIYVYRVDIILTEDESALQAQIYYITLINKVQAQGTAIFFLQ